MRINYSIETDPNSTVRSMGRELSISRKHAREICCAIKGMDLPDAREYLTGVVELKKAVPIRMYKRNVPHRKGMAAGRYPQKAAQEFLKILKNAESNAEYKGMEPGNMKIIHAATKKGVTVHGMFPRAQGRATPKQHERVTVELVLEEAK